MIKINNNQEKLKALENLKSLYKNCQACPLAFQGRTKIVFGAGNCDANLMFIGEGPGKDEDAQGKPFIGRSGKLLTNIIESMGLTREDVYISNIVKCRPPKNRPPTPEEEKTCTDILLWKEIEIIKPAIICTLGATATQALLGTCIKISIVRGKFQLVNNHLIMPTYHPAYLLRNPQKRESFEVDMKKIMTKLKTE